MKEFGIDISKWQGNFNFNTAVNEGVKFVIIKGGGGDAGLYKDSKFERNYSEAKSYNLPVGVYWFSKALTIVEAEREADYFYENCLKDKQFELPIYMDVENSTQLAVGRRLLTDIIKAWCSRLESKKFLVGIYSSKAFFSSYVYDNELLHYHHWVAQWSSNCTYFNTECLGMWQFGGETNTIRTNKVAGVVCDQDYMLIDYPSLIKSAGYNGYAKVTVNPVVVPTPQPKPQLKPDAVIVQEVLDGKWGNGAIRKQRLTDAGYSYALIQGLINKTLINQFTVGDKVKLLANGVVYGTTRKFLPWVYKMALYVRKIEGNCIVVSIFKTGPITGAVDKKYLMKV